MNIRVRIAPTPSGKLHLGTSHTALFNWLFSQHNKGRFVLRIDDSDPKRCKKEYEQDILASLKWLGLNWDEGPDIGGPYGPYRQSERMDHYWPYVEKLLKEKKAYYCYCTPEELDKERKKITKTGKAPKYSGKCRNLTEKQIKEYQKQGRKPAVRLIAANKKVSFTDPARGKITVDANDFGDFIIARADKTALLMLAATVDDIEMKITHTIRGEDYINFVPRQILLFEALGVKPPTFAHLPFVYAQDGSKLSKRHGAVAVSDYRKMGYLPEAIFNYLVLLGWSPGDDREILSKNEIIKLFSLEKVNTNPHRFDFNKLKWINGVYIRKKDDKKLLQLIKPHIKSSKLKAQSSKLLKIIPLIKERIFTLKDADYLIEFFAKDIKYDKKLLFSKGGNEQLVKNQLEKAFNQLKNIKNWSLENITKTMQTLCTSNNWKPSQFFMALRVAVTGKTITPPLFESMEILDKEKTLHKIKIALKKLK